MSINTQDSSSSGAYNANYDPNVDNSALDSTATSTSSTSTTVGPNGLPLIKDTSQTSEDQAQPKDYQRSSAKPALPQPSGSTGSVDEAVIAQLYDPHQFIEYLKSSDSTPGPAAQQQKDEWAKEKVDDPEINALAAQLGMSPGEVQAKLRVTDSVYFKQLIKDLPEEQQNQLIFAHNNPQSANKLSPELKALLKTIHEKIAHEIKSDSTLSGFTFSNDWPGVTPDVEDFNDNITAEFDSAVESKITNMELGEQITHTQALNLRAMHYMPGSFANDAALQKLFAQVEGGVINNLQSKYGAGADWTPKADTGYLTQVTNGFFRQNFQTQLNAFQPPLSDDQKQEIMKLFENPGITPSNGDMGKILTKITALSTAATIEKFGLDSTWAPVAGPIININAVNNPQIQMAMDGYNTAKSLFDKFSTMVNGLPDGPTKSAYVQYLKIIGESLNKLQEFLYSVSSTDAASSKKMSRANMDATLADIDRSQKQIAEAKAKEADTKKLDLGPLGDINNWLGQIVSLVVSCVTSFAIGVTLAAVLGPVAGAVIGAVFLAAAIAYFVDKAISTANGTPSLASKIMTEIDNLVPTAGGGAALTGLFSMILGGGNPFLTLNLMNDGKTIQKFIRAAGGSRSDEEIGAAVFNGAAQVVIMVAMMVAIGPAAAPGFAAQITATISQVTGASVKAIQTTLNVVSLTFTVAMGALQATQQGIQCKWELVQAEISKILSESEAASEEVKALIATLRKLINKLLEAMKGTTEDIVVISKTQAKKYDDVSSLTNEIQG